MYRAPVKDILHAMNDVAGLQSAIEAGAFGDLSADLVEAVMEEAGKFATEQLAPLNRSTDETGAKLENAVVTVPAGIKEAYHAWIEGGWNSIAAPEEFGGQQLPNTMAIAASEMWNSACMAFGLCPLLTIGAIEALHTHGSDELKSKYLEKLISGEWTGTMNLTEPNCGSDLSALKSRAEPGPDGTYRIFGQKIFITYGEHEITDNICHLVLARLPDAPAGTRGISLFLVPKYPVNDDGTLGARNDLYCHSIEHKLGIHGSPTCTMIYGDGFAGEEKGAIGYLIGEENRGLNCMFTMMNNARLNVGTQGVAIAEAAYQHALGYAHERKQGKSASYEGDGMSPIVEHPDIMRNLLTMKALTQAARNICYSCAFALDMSRVSEDKEFWSERAGLLTPIAKAFSTDIGCEVASIGVQCHGGMGFIEETGAAQYLRDARINPIYEGTNGIQAIDLVTRKLPMSGGEAVKSFIAELRETVEQVRGTNHGEFAESAQKLEQAIDDLELSTDWMLEQLAGGKTEAALAGATPYQHQFGLTAGGVYLAKAGLMDNQRAELARYFADNLLTETMALKSTVLNGADSLLNARSLLNVA